MRIYIAGPISGIEKNNAPSFALTAERLLEAGHTPINPLDYAPPELIKMSIEMGEKVRETPEYRHMMKRCLELVSVSDGMVTLTGWQHSKGAYLERTYADTIGVPVLDLDDLCANPVPQLKWVGDSGLGPSRIYPGDAGFDLFVDETTIIRSGEFRDVPCGICVELPPSTWALVTGRSSTLRKRQLLVSQGIIDNGYRGDLYVGVQNLAPSERVVERGERIAQLIPFPLTAATIQVARVDELSDSDRGTNGFGSTGA